jgi:hypothetical protein
MIRRQPADPAPGPLEEFAARFDDHLATLAQRQAFRRYLEGLLLPAERNKTLTVLTNTEPLLGLSAKRHSNFSGFTQRFASFSDRLRCLFDGVLCDDLRLEGEYLGIRGIH